MRTAKIMSLGALVAATCALGIAVAPAAALAAPGVRWSVSSIALPTDFPTAENQLCIEGTTGDAYCPRYVVSATDEGAGASEGPVTITDTLPAGVTFRHLSTTPPSGAQVAEGVEWASGKRFPCTESEVEGRSQVKCVYGEKGETAAAGDTLRVGIFVTPTGRQAGTLRNEVKVSGGGGLEASSAPSNPIGGAPAQFGVEAFSLQATDQSGQTDTQAGSHPYALRTSFELNSELDPTSSSAQNVKPVQSPRSLIVTLPLGFVGDPQAVEQCAEHELAREECPLQSRVGTIASEIAGYEYGFNQEYVYNLIPEAGYPAEFGFVVNGLTFTLYPTVVRTAEGYKLKVAIPGFYHELRGGSNSVIGGSVTMYGDPGAFNATRSEAFLTNPAACAGTPLKAKLEVDSWDEPGNWQRAESTVYPNGITGCDHLQFNPEMQVAPYETSRADTPSGYEVKLGVRQGANTFGSLAPPDLKEATVSFPQGVSLSPAAANGASGLVGCEAQGPNGINIGSNEITPEGQDLADPYATELGEGHAGPGGNGSPYDDGLWHIAPGRCPLGSRIGSVRIKTPLLKEELIGHVFLAQPECGGSGQPECTPQDAADGKIYGLYIEASGEGVIIKLKGQAHVNPSTGQITTTFKENPQLPFETLTLKLHGGQRAPLANPQTCGIATATSELVPWGGPTATPPSEFAITGCKSPTPFSPAVEAGTQQPFGGAFSPFVLTLKRNDGEQNLAGVNVTMPPGVAGMLSKVPLCGQAQAAAGTCSEASRIGTAHVAAGAGSEPLWLEGGVYLTGPYDGDPFGLSIVVPAKAGPYNLGDEVVRSGISVNPVTAQVSVSTPTIRQSRDGIPFRLKEISVEINRPGFMFNPTSCEQLHLTGSVTGVMPNGTAGSTVPISEPFADTGCKNLPFKPKFSALIHAHHSKKDGEYLHVVIGSAFGQANLREVHVTLPAKLPSRDSTLKLACSEAQFAADPAGCPAGSFVGHAVVRTPVLRKPLVGPAIFVSHGGRAFPNLDLVLQGEGVTIVNEGDTFINKKGITTSTFAAVPDVPVNRISLVLPAGPHSALAGNGDMCKHTLHMPTTLTGQNGAVITRKTKIMVEGCKAEIAVLKHRVHGAKATIILHVPSAGKLIASGKGIGRAIKRVRKKGGRVGITVHLKRHFRSRLRHGRRHHMRVHIHLKFKPRHGKTITAHVNVKLR